MGVREEFEKARKAHARIPELNDLIAEGGLDWRPPFGVSGAGGDPVSSKALATMAALEAERAELVELEACVGWCLRVIEGVRAALGDAYADVLDLYYIDALGWGDVADECRMTSRTAMRHRDVALDWIEAVGEARAMEGLGVAT